MFTKWVIVGMMVAVVLLTGGIFLVATRNEVIIRNQPYTPRGILVTKASLTKGGFIRISHLYNIDTNVVFSGYMPPGTYKNFYLHYTDVADLDPDPISREGVSPVHPGEYLTASLLESGSNQLNFNGVPSYWPSTLRPLKDILGRDVIRRFRIEW